MSNTYQYSGIHRLNLYAYWFLWNFQNYVLILNRFIVHLYWPPLLVSAAARSPGNEEQPCRQTYTEPRSAPCQISEIAPFVWFSGYQFHTPDLTNRYRHCTPLQILWPTRMYLTDKPLKLTRYYHSLMFSKSN